MTGYHSEELIHHAIAEFFNRKNLSIIKKQLKKREKGERGMYEIEWKTKHGFPLRTIVSSSPIYDDAGNYIGSIAVITDITGYIKK